MAPGNSSLAQLKRFPINTLEGDRSFIREIERSEEDSALTGAITAMGNILSLTIIAEGVETEAQVDFLRERACDEIQGFCFSKSLPAEDFASFMSENQRVAVG